MFARTSALVLVMVLAPGALWSQQDPLEKLVGTWKQTPDPGPPPQIRLHRWELLGKDRMKHVSERVNAQGERSVDDGQIDIYDGKEHPDGPGRVVLFRRIDANIIQQIRTSIQDGKILRFLERVISPDGRTLTIRQIGTDRQGRSVSEVRIYKKQ